MKKDKILNSFDSKKELAPNFWVDGVLKSKVRERLLSVAHDFMDISKIDWSKLIDIVLTGSIANYTWSSYSDVDLHIIVDFSELELPEDLLWDYFSAKKDAWNKTHENLFVYGFPVEIYVEDKTEYAGSTGVYSLMNDCWIKKPSQEKSRILSNKEKIKRVSKKYIKAILFYKKRAYASDDKETLLNTKEKLLTIFKILRNKRSEGLATPEKEMSFGNLLWKCIKRLGLIAEIWNTINYIYDKLYSINEGQQSVFERFNFDKIGDEEEIDDGLSAISKMHTKFKYFPATKEDLRKIIQEKIKEAVIENDVDDDTEPEDLVNEENESAVIDLNDIYVGQITDMSLLFDALRAHQLFDYDVSSWDVSKVTNMSGMFLECTNMSGEYLRDWDVSNVKDMSDMFYACRNLGTNYLGINILRKWDVSNVENMSRMFQLCENLESAGIGNWDVSNVENMSWMFDGCSYFKEDLSRWDVSNVNNMSCMFTECKSFLPSSLGEWKVKSDAKVELMFLHTAPEENNLPQWYLNSLKNVSERFNFDVNDDDKEILDNSTDNLKNISSELNREKFFKDFILDSGDKEKLGSPNFPFLLCFKRGEKDGDDIEINMSNFVFGWSSSLYREMNIVFNDGSYKIVAPNYMFDSIYNMSNHFNKTNLFQDGWLPVCLTKESFKDAKTKYRNNFINEKGELLSDVGYYHVSPFKNGLACVGDGVPVELDNPGSYIIDTKGNDICKGKRSCNYVYMDELTSYGISPFYDTKNHDEFISSTGEHCTTGCYIQLNGEYAFQGKVFVNPSRPIEINGVTICTVGEIIKSPTGVGKPQVGYYIINMHGTDLCKGKRFSRISSLPANNHGIFEVKIFKRNDKSYYININGDFVDYGGNLLDDQDAPIVQTYAIIDKFKKAYPNSCVWTGGLWTEEANDYEKLPASLLKRRKTNVKDPNGKLRNATWYAVVIALSELGPLNRNEILHIVFPNGTAKHTELFTFLKKNGIIKLITSGPNRNRYELDFD